MSKVLIVYGSTTGNTETAAGYVADVLRKHGADVALKNAADVEAEGLARGWDLVLLGSSTWGDEDIELQDDFVHLYEGLDQAGLDGVKTAVFGCGDSGYPHFCGAVDALEERARDLGAVLVVDGLKIDGDPERGEIAAWAETVAVHV
ncbi:flavodoxin [Desulfovibrio aminophilus]|uniref:flavodoxin n=1 Tax=Desulfovibrio aminophilus TaxID=81425 RepID=UPI0004148B60|nr:flavodoxin [Desulfovibrio aminophilus]